MKAWSKTVLDKDVVLRFKKLGDMGEFLAERLLEEVGFSQIKNLNKTRQNTKCFDLIAKRGAQSYAISVKTRNRFENSIAGEKLNTRYKLTDNPELFEAEAQKYTSCAAWLAVPVDINKGTLDAFFGTLQNLKGNKKGILISPKSIEKYEQLALQRRFSDMGISDVEIATLINIYQRK
jgi:Holliday junction resolvase-like predicted endonuclease